jgi:hypothetical protein
MIMQYLAFMGIYKQINTITQYIQSLGIDIT